jgi:hypothetical protein
MQLPKSGNHPWQHRHAMLVRKEVGSAVLNPIPLHPCRAPGYLSEGSHVAERSEPSRTRGDLLARDEPGRSCTQGTRRSPRNRHRGRSRARRGARSHTTLDRRPRSRHLGTTALGTGHSNDNVDPPPARSTARRERGCEPPRKPLGGAGDDWAARRAGLGSKVRLDRSSTVLRRSHGLADGCLEARPRTRCPRAPITPRRCWVAR